LCFVVNVYLTWLKKEASVIKWFVCTVMHQFFMLSKKIKYFKNKICNVRVLRFFSESQVAECKISDRQFSENHLFEQPNFQTDKCSKRQIFELIFVRITNFRMCKIFEQKLVLTGVILSSLDLTNLT
jgi:hypothetical protein